MAAFPAAHNVADITKTPDRGLNPAGTGWDVRIRIYNKAVTICNFKAVITFQRYFRSLPFVARVQTAKQNQ